MADIVGRTSSALAGELLGLDEAEAEGQRPAFARSGLTSDPVVSAAEPAAEDTFRSAYRLSDEGVVILDQRRLPEALEEVVASVAAMSPTTCGWASPAAARSWPGFGGLWPGPDRDRARRAAAEQRHVELRRTASALFDARVSSRLLAWAIERMRQRATTVDDAPPA